MVYDGGTSSSLLFGPRKMDNVLLTSLFHWQHRVRAMITRCKRVVSGPGRCIISRHAALVLCCAFALPSIALAHGTESHGDEPAEVSKPAPTQEAPPGEEPAHAAESGETNVGPAAESDVSRQHGEAHGAPDEEATTGSRLSVDAVLRDLNFADFPTLHPMAVHVPVTFIPLALLFALLSLFTSRRTMVGLAFGFTLGGLAGGWVAAFPLHPHATGLSPLALETLRKHDFFAYGTLWLVVLAAVVGLICLWKPGTLRKLGFSVVLLLATLSVSVTAHYGGTLAYVHGIGVQGHFLSPH